MNKKYKIALIVYNFSGGGLERVVSSSSFIFSDAGYDVHLYVLSSEIGYDFAATLHQFPLEKLSFWEKIKAYINISKSIKKEKFDSIIDHRCRLNFIMELFWTKIIYHKQKVFHYIHSSKISGFLFESQIVNQFLYKGIFISICNEMTKILVSKFPKSPFKTIYNPIYIKSLQENNSIQENYIVSISRMSEENEKQVDILIECYAKSTLPSKGIRLKIIGDGAGRKRMEELAQELKISQWVDFLGFLPQPYSYLEKAKFSVLTSRYEGLGMALIESLMCGTPAISFDCPTGPSEIIQHLENGILVENQNKTEMIKALNLLAENEDLYKKLKNNASKSIEKFKPSHFIKNWEYLFSQI